MVGCDMMLGSNAREDKCRECRGNGSNCITTAGLLDSQDLIMGKLIDSYTFDINLTKFLRCNSALCKL